MRYYTTFTNVFKQCALNIKIELSHHLLSNELTKKESQQENKEIIVKKSSNENRFDIFEHGNRIAIFMTIEDIMSEFNAIDFQSALRSALVAGLEVKKSTEWYYL